MENKVSRFSKEKGWDYFILVARFLIGWTFLSYGFSKLTGGQFGISEAELLQPLKEVSLFKLSWYLFEHEPFNTFIGISQIICGILLIINRTVLLGAFLFLPIVTTILIIDLSFMPAVLAEGFAWRLSFYILLDGLILLHYKEKLKLIWSAVYRNTNTKFKFKIGAYLLLPVLAILLEVIGVIPKVVKRFIVSPYQTYQDFGEFWAYLNEMFEKLI